MAKNKDRVELARYVASLMAYYLNGNMEGAKVQARKIVAKLTAMGLLPGG